MNTLDKTIDRTPNLACPACQVKRLHTKEEQLKYHPLMGTGVNEYFPKVKKQ